MAPKAEVTRSAGANLVFCSLALFLVPLAVFFTVYKGGIDFILGRLVKHSITDWSRAVCGAILAVLTVNGVLIAFVLTAFNETPAQTEKKKQ